MSDMRPFELQSFEDEVLLQERLAQAREILDAAKRDRDRIREEARLEGLAAARAEVLTSERERLAPEIAAARDLLMSAVEGVQAKRSELLAAAERDLVRLAVAIAGKIVKKEVRSSGEIVQENVRRAVELSVNRQSLRILVHPGDLEAIERLFPDLRRGFADLTEVSIEGSATVDRGGCIVSTREGQVDATIATQLEEIERGLLG